MVNLNSVLKLKPLNALMTAQFLSAFVDNMILFIALAVINRDGYPGYYLPLVQSAFLLSYIVLAPWVGRFADKKAKSLVLIIGNILKSLGITMLLLNLNPALSYAVVGVGAVVYSPAKYGILPELTDSEETLLKANSTIESFTILAILTGSIAGGFLSDLSIVLSLVVCLVLYGLSIVFNTFIPARTGNSSITFKNSVSEFIADSKQLFRSKQAFYSLAGTGAFWQASAVLRMILIAWLPIVLNITTNTQISMIVAITGVGIVVGAAITPYLVTVRTYTRTAFYGLAMVPCILAFTVLHSLTLTVIFLLLIGCLGGIFIVPMNTCLQQVGHASIGSGKTIAIQNFVNNVFMFAGVSAYTAASKTGVTPNSAITAMGIVFFLLVMVLFRIKTAGRLDKVL